MVPGYTYVVAFYSDSETLSALLQIESCALENNLFFMIGIVWCCVAFKAYAQDYGNLVNFFCRTHTFD